MNHITEAGQILADDLVRATPGNRVSLGRRAFLTTGAALGGGLLIGVARPRYAHAATTATVNVFVVIGSDNSITLITPGAEMGQGINAGLAQVLREELSFDWAILKTVSAPYGPQYGRGATRSQTTGGSNNMRGWFTLMLQAGATAREMLLAAARAQFPSAPLPLQAVLGVVKDANGVTLATYGALAPAAALITLPGTAPILSASAGYKVVGQSLARPDIRLKVDGSAVFGIDVRVAGMVHGVVRHCPTLGGTVKSVGSAPTGTQLVNLGDAVAVTAANTWKAMQAAKALSVSWNIPTESALAAVDTASLASQAQSLMTSATPLANGGTLAIAEQLGDITAGMAAASKKLTLTYSLPFLAHACMEVLNCTVQLTKNISGTVTGCQIWCPTQAPDRVAKTAAALTGITDMTKISVTTTYLGGGLGLKIEQHYVEQAIRVAMALNKPVKLTWPREEDFARDWMRPSALSRVQVGLDGGGNITAWSNRIVSPSLSRSHGTAPKNGLDGISIGRATGLPYAMGSRLVEYVEQITGMRIGFWRSVGESISCFVVESAIDECAIAAGKDPLAYRRGLLAGKTAELGVLNAAAALAGWGTALPSGRARGIALSPGFGSLAAMVAELALTSTGAILVARICVAVDCGMAVNPNQVESQIQGAVIHGLSSARWSKMPFDKGVSQVKNFGDYRLSRMSDTPRIDMVIVNQGSALGGIGEVGVPGIAPALANAYAALTGTRKRSLPLGF